MYESGPPLRLPNGIPFRFAPGRHNSLLVDVLELFGPRYAPNALILYVQETANNLFIYERERLAQLGVPITPDDHLADCILYQEDSKRLYFICTVNSYGPISQKRKYDLEKMLKMCRVERVYISVLFNRVDYRQFAAHIAWGTHVWLAQIPDHIISHR